ncbi:MAG: ABC transporter permease [Gammaproteobacteria bacterium]|nr:ABC transporter permease [Gammaproteobacteria bacterium]
MTGWEQTPNSFSASAGRVYALVMRYTYLLKGSWPRLIELGYWPTVQVCLWGFMTIFLAQHTNYVAQAFGVLMSAVLLWDILFRGQIGVAICFMEEMWSRNIGHLFVSPLRTYEMIIALLVMSGLRTLIGIIPATFFAYAFFDYSIYAGLGLALVGFFLGLLIMGWAIGLLVSGIILRYGLGAESLAWVTVFALAPISGIWYPVSVLPDWLQTIAYTLPSTYIFEGMRAILIDGAFRTDLMVKAFALDAVYIGLGAYAFIALFERARREGQLLQTGE